MNFTYASKFLVFETEQPGAFNVEFDFDNRQRLVGGEVALRVPARDKHIV